MSRLKFVLAVSFAAAYICLVIFSDKVSSQTGKAEKHDLSELSGNQSIALTVATEARRALTI